MLKDWNVKIFVDGASLKDIEEMSSKKWVDGFTTNPTLMRQAGVKDYVAFAKEALEIVGGKPISFEVFADDFSEMEDQAREIASWGREVYVKIPVTNTKGEFAGPLIKRLSQDGIPLNVTALMTYEQTIAVAECIDETTPAILSIFAGRLADTGRDPMLLMSEVLEKIDDQRNIELLWASSREIGNVMQADEIGCHIITLPPDLLKKVPLLGKDLNEYSLETVKMFYKDALAAGYVIPCKSLSNY